MDSSYPARTGDERIERILRCRTLILLAVPLKLCIIPRRLLRNERRLLCPLIAQSNSHRTIDDPADHVT